MDMVPDSTLIVLHQVLSFLAAGAGALIWQPIHSTWHMVKPHPTRHSAEPHGDRTSPTSALVPATGTLSHSTTGIPGTANTVALPFGGAQSLTRGMGITCSQQPSEALVGLPTDLAFPQPCREDPVVPSHYTINL